MASQVVSDDGALEKAVDEALAANPDIVEKLKSGNMKPMGAIIGARHACHSRSG